MTSVNDPRGAQFEIGRHGANLPIRLAKTSWLGSIRQRQQMRRLKMRQALSMVVAVGLVAIASSAALAQQKTVKACTEEWRANKADNQAKGITEKAYGAQCRAGTAATQPPAQPTAAPAQPAAPARQTAPPTGANQSASEPQAKARCGSDLVVWVNTSSHIYHFSGHRDYGHTKNGTYMCERDATAAGARAAKNEKRPGT